MVMIANYQYGWTFFVPDIQKKFGWDRASIQWAFTLFVLFETWLVPIEGWFVDKYGPRLVVLVGGILCAIGWAINAQATTLNGYYLGMIIAGIGAGGVYGTCVGNALKWFPDKRGLAAGITAAGFGAGSALTVAPIQAMIKDSGFQTTFLYFGLGQGIVIVILAFFLLAPKPGQVPAVVQNANVIQTRRNYQPTEVMRQPIFWLMYFMFVIVGAGGLMVTANLKPIAVDWKVDSIPVTLIGMTMTAVTFAATIDRILNGLTRPFFGWISDMIGRENTMFIAFGIEGDRHLGALHARPRSGLVRDPVGPRVLRLGRDLFAVPVDLHRYVRRQIRDHQCRPALYRQGHRGPAGADRELHAAVVRQLGQRVHHRGRRQHPGVAAGHRRAEALAQNRGGAGHRVSTAFAVSSRSARPPGRALFLWPCAFPALNFCGCGRFNLGPIAYSDGCSAIQDALAYWHIIYQPSATLR